MAARNNGKYFKLILIDFILFLIRFAINKLTTIVRCERVVDLQGHIA